ncbi:MAG: hypothetical protein HFJ41_05580 [Clostridia bacterium]|nr:hypothetical protein [Clostridia bacterium]
MKLSNNRTIADCWLPTFENVAREFIIENLKNIISSDEIPNFKFDFREEEGIEFIEDIIKRYIETFKDYDFKEEIQTRYEKLLQKIKQKTNENEEIPVVIVNDYKKFFEYLRQAYERHIELYFQRRKDSTGFNRWEKNNFFELIWLRATPQDFNNPEEFLKKQAEMMKDTTFEKYDEETYLGKLECLNNHIITIKNGIARTWDENFRQMEITIYDKEYYTNKELWNRPHCTLPVIRYGIYEKDGKKICSIGSIQHKSDSSDEEKLEKKVDRQKYRINKDIPEEDKEKVEPKSLIALSIFVNLLHKEGITDIEVPSMYVLDHEYHRKRNKYLLKEFKEEWTKVDYWDREERQKREKYPEDYQKAYKNFMKMFRKEDLISEIKTERQLLTARRLLKHYPKANITAYPEEIDNYMHMQIPVVKDASEINGELLKELYNLVQALDIEKQEDPANQEIQTAPHKNKVDDKWLEEFFSL